ncbi:MAG TPA: lysophospholipid acyltransferase family protein [Candidatus Tectomicrobia bacterium]|nr:lysophospholipid acyltransferase family protein [Candidatus Tectomicrobia bacterium]
MPPMLLSFIPTPAAWLIKAICATLRVQVLRGEIEQTVRARRRNVIYAFWHGHLLYLMYRYRGSGVYILVSQSRDGEWLSRVLRRFGLPTIRGSSSRGGWRSLRELVQLTRNGASAAVAPDGPRGPRHRAQGGIIALARLTEIPVIPVAVGARWKVEFHSWDGFLLPLPGSRVVVAYGEPVVVPSGADAELMEQKRQELESKLLKLTEEVTLATSPNIPSPSGRE